MQDNAKDKNHSPIDATLLMRQVRSSLIAQRLEPAPLVRAVLDPDAAFRACNVRYILLNRLPVTLLLVSSTGQRAAKKSLDTHQHVSLTLPLLDNKPEIVLQGLVRGGVRKLLVKKAANGDQLRAENACSFFAGLHILLGC